MTATCPHCRMPVDPQATICPHCRGKIVTAESRKKRNRQVLMLILLIMAVCCLCFAPSIGFWLRGERPVRPEPEAGEPAPPFAEIEAAAADMTDAQWGDYASDLVGRRIEGWEGVVFDVDVGEVLGGYTVYFDSGSTSFISDVYVTVDEETALALDKGASYQLDGRITGAVNIGLFAIYVDQATFTPLE